jgi:hypothetical protein
LNIPQFFVRLIKPIARLVTAAAIAVIVDPAMAMAVNEVGAADHAANDAADNRPWRARNHCTGAGTDGDAFQRSGLCR